MVTNLPTNVDASYPNRSQGDAQHQQHHDVVHTALNDLTAEVETGRLSPDGLNAAIEDGDYDLAGTWDFTDATVIGLAGGGSGDVTLSGAQTFTGVKRFTAMPKIHGNAGDSAQVYARAHTDGLATGPINLMHDGAAGHVIHATTGPNTNPLRTVTDLVTTSGSATITSATASFRGAGVGTDIGTAISGAGIPAGATITAVASSTSATISANATATATGVTADIGTGNANGAVIAIGVDNAATGVLVRNKWKGIALQVDHLSTSQAGSYGMFVKHQGANGPAIRYNYEASAGATADLAIYSVPSGNTIPSGAAWVQYQANLVSGNGVAGKIRADTGNIEWSRSIKATAPNSSVVPTIGVADEAATSAETYIGASTVGHHGLKNYRWSGAGATAYATSVDCSSDRIRIRVGDGAQAKGSETMRTAFEAQAHSVQARIGFYGVTPVIRASAISSPSADVTSLKTAVDALRVALTNVGITQ